MNHDTESKKKEIVKYLLSQHVLVKPELLNRISEQTQLEQVYQLVQQGTPAELLFEQNVTMQPKKEEYTIPSQSSVFQQNQSQFISRVKIISQYKDKPKKLTPQDFTNHFNARFSILEKFLQHRQELQNLTSIARLTNKKDRETVSFVGMVADKQITKNENISLIIEDPSGSIKVMVSKNKPETHAIAQDVVCDEVIGITGNSGNNVVFANTVVRPDIPLTSEIKKSPDEVYAAVLSCIHVGSKLFLRDAFERFIKWLRGEAGNEHQREIARKVGYVFIAGDLVDGVGIYPNQESELLIKDIYEQYNEAARLLSQIPKHIALIICPGNHDAGRISEPQPPHSPTYAKALYTLPNAFLLCNPCVVNIHSSENFPGFNILLYHGYSFDDYGEIVPSIKNSGKNISERSPLIMKFLLQCRHLAPTHSSTLYIPDSEKDNLIIEQVPDFFIAGHIHKSNTASYRGVGIVCGSCFQAKTSFQEKMGHEPDPGRVPLINLQTRKVHIIRF